MNNYTEIRTLTEFKSAVIDHVGRDFNVWPTINNTLVITRRFYWNEAIPAQILTLLGNDLKGRSFDDIGNAADFAAAYFVPGEKNKVEITLRGDYVTAAGYSVKVKYIGKNSLYVLLDQWGFGFFTNKLGVYELDSDYTIVAAKCCGYKCPNLLPVDHLDGICDDCWEALENANLYPQD